MLIQTNIIRCLKKVCTITKNRYYSSKVIDIRNIGILAHIDAGKTTTTERMLFYSGKTRSLGEVHRGNTVTDYLTQERDRGITICSSAVTFQWNDAKINLLDTPGHIDFTMEVEQSLFAVDGVIIVLDGTAGVEAQTLTVWSQAEKHKLPKMIFINKMDRPDANFDASVKDITSRLDIRPICLQYPEKDSKANLSIIDVVTLNRISWNPETYGRTFRVEPLKDKSLDEAVNFRNNLIDDLSGIDDELADTVISAESFNTVSNDLIWSAVRRATCSHKAVPVLLGSAYKNVGIQPLMDSVIRFLPAPHERNQLYDCFGNDFVGKVFKIVHDKQRGPLTLIRVLRGSLKKGMRLINTKSSTESLQRIYEPLADEYREINEVPCGGVAVCSGLKNTVTGDLLTSSASSIKQAQKKLQKILGKSDVDDEEDNMETINEVLSLDPQIPDAVYFCSIEPPSIGSQTAMEAALKQLQREDPSLRVNFDETTGQTVLGGMGELHMDIVKSRILTEYKIDVDLGPLQIAYKETIESPAIDTFTLEKEIAGSKQSVTITLELVNDQKEIFNLSKSQENMANLNTLRPKTLQVIKKGAIAALERGPRVGGQVVETQVRLHNATIGRGTADSFVMAATGQCVQKILINSGTRLLEPIMAVQIIVPSERVSTVLADLSRRRAKINDVQPKGQQNKLIDVQAPLAELSGYTSVIRTITSGTASMTMQPCGYSNMNSQDEVVAIRRAQGLE
ncbi:ribosome-releasing factor 2, mitochondrial [Episyrphus balteatus]|uniref:ribosome-releasing factor 2, mitochondrial n=1 Tax=Episyrphus balteatus TaxID=286459 RepID=UPI00248520E0|nr:ribosome-releasing factor 2, mitochondrial [Episyrphus balteatus]